MDDSDARGCPRQYQGVLMAVSPPPTTTTGFSLKRKPSQVAQELTPPPLKSYSPSTPSQRLSAPVAMTTLWLVRLLPSVYILKSDSPASMRTTFSSRNLAPNDDACCRISCTMTGPVMPVTPGKFSTRTPFPCSCPPSEGATMTGLSPALAA